MTNTYDENFLRGKVAYIAGGTRGMNLAIAQSFVNHGARVAVMSRNAERVQAAVSQLSEGGRDALGFAIDARDYEAVEQSMAEVAEAYGGLDIVVAGQAGNFYAPVLGMSSKGFKTIIDIDLIGTFNVFKASYPFLKRPGASLIAITAPEAVRPLHFQSHVCAAKAGVNMLIRCLALEWGPVGVRVNGLSPGPIEGSWGMKNVAAPNPEWVDKITRAMPLRRWGKEEDVANTALFLASEAAGYVTGTIVEVDGGAAIASPESGDVDAVVNPESDSRVRGASGRS